MADTRLVLFLDYDFNSPPGKDGLYRVLAPDFLVNLPAVGDEITFGVKADGVVRRGKVKREYRMLLVEGLEWE